MAPGSKNRFLRCLGFPFINFEALMAQIISIESDRRRSHQRGIKALAAGSLSSKKIGALLLAIIVFVAGAVLVVWTHDKKVQFAYEISNGSKNLEVLREENLRLVLMRNEKLHPDRLVFFAKEFGLVKPQIDQIITVRDENQYN